MLITAATSQVYSCLEIAEKALPVRSSVPMINNILFEAQETGLTFSSTNLEMAITVSMGHQGSESGKILLPPKIVDIMRYFPVPEVNIDINWDSCMINIYGGSAHFKLHGADAGDYPVATFGRLEEGTSFSIPQQQLKNILKAVIFAASAEETRPAFNGILLTFDDRRLKLTASDTYRLVVKEVSNENWSFENRKCLVPARVLREFLRVIGDSDQEVLLAVDQKTMSFNFDSIHFTSRLLEEKYPDVSGVIPTAYKTRIVIERKGFEDIISRAALLAEGKNQAVNLILSNGQLEARVAAQEGSMEEQMAVEQEGDDIDLFVNTRFMLDILKIIDDQNMIIDFHGNDGPLVFRLVDDPAYLYLVLPIKKIT